MAILSTTIHFSILLYFYNFIDDFLIWSFNNLLKFVSLCLFFIDSGSLLYQLNPLYVIHFSTACVFVCFIDIILMNLFWCCSYVHYLFLQYSHTMMAFYLIYIMYKNTIEDHSLLRTHPLCKHK